MSTLEVSIVIPAYNAASQIGALFESIERIGSHASFEVIVVDDCSTDDTAALVRAWCEKPLPFARRLVQLPTNGGPGRARNSGAYAAQGRYLAFTDSDCRVDGGWLDALLGAVDPAGGIVGAGGRVLNVEESFFAFYITFFHVLEPPGNLPYLVTCNCMYQRDAFVQARGFPEDIGVAGGEDIALSIALWKLGRRFAFAPDAIIYHRHKDTWGRFARTWRNYGYGTGIVLRRMLTAEELSNRPLDIEHYWDGSPYRPRIQSHRLRGLLKHCREAGLGRGFTCRLALLWGIERTMYAWGWWLGSRRSA